MILVIGGFAAGKHSYVVQTLGYSDEQIAFGVLDDKPVLANLHELIGNESLSIDEALLEKLRAKEVITCCEVGSGIVPLKESERRYREEVGRLCAELANSADKVIRVYCGIPTVLKG